MGLPDGTVSNDPSYRKYEKSSFRKSQLKQRNQWLPFPTNSSATLNMLSMHAYRNPGTTCGLVLWAALIKDDTMFG